ncbi:MAG: carbon storage regulator CsrA [Geothrix sp.]|uniref:carbon storage regulator CsrA n=1 Tax=Geothrix sp. TaxID=1962974 RepID=UPI00181A5C2C|nr:carbon storage regulator CsrA [Geothrix sp.]NWJ41396.1 carbon storage regulator CsrA [Geothrix sp.]WIL20617.1 MAG: carbon storage regulator CsrA [Geothrix sp.]
MLVITRKPEQSIVIGGEVEVIVLGITKDGVRLGIKAPLTVQVHRREVFEAIAAENRAATASKVPVQDVAALLRAAQVRKPHTR